MPIISNFPYQTYGKVSQPTVVEIPYQIGTLVYNGELQQPAWANYNSAIMTIGGAFSSVNAGTYFATFSLNGNYVWSDGSQDSQTVPWTMDKITGTASLSSTSVTVGTNISAHVFLTLDPYDDSVNVQLTNRSSYFTAQYNPENMRITVTGLSNTGTGTIFVTVTSDNVDYEWQTIETISVTCSATAG